MGPWEEGHTYIFLETHKDSWENDVLEIFHVWELLDKQALVLRLSVDRARKEEAREREYVEQLSNLGGKVWMTAVGQAFWCLQFLVYHKKKQKWIWEISNLLNYFS